MHRAASAVQCSTGNNGIASAVRLLPFYVVSNFEGFVASLVQDGNLCGRGILLTDLRIVIVSPGYADSKNSMLKLTVN